MPTTCSSRSFSAASAQLTTAVAAGIDVSTLAGVKFAYPSYSAVIGLAARALLAEPSSPGPAAAAEG